MPKYPHYDLLVRGGTVIDGSKAPRFVSDVGVRQGRIAAVGDLRSHTADEVLDATGMIVAPGFIDSHTHDDQAVLSQAEMSFKVSQGVTTVVTGNCGLSAAPLKADMHLPSPIDILQTPPSQRYSTFAAYLAALRATPSSVNVVPLVGHTTLRAVVMDSLDRAATPDEVAEMRILLEEALAAGALGISTGTWYPPARHATTEEVLGVCAPLASHGAMYVTHMRHEDHRVMDALEETFHIGRTLGVTVLVSHHKVMHSANFGLTRETLPFILETMKKQPVCLDCYPYTAGSTMILTDPDMLKNRVTIASSEPHPECAGRDLDNIAQDWGVSVVQAAERLRPGTAIYHFIDETEMQKIMAFDETMIGSDGIPVGNKPHPRLWGTFPRVLGRYSRDLSLFPLETAVWKMTGLTARNFGLLDRGEIKQGHHADLVVFDADTVKDRATYENPTLAAEGIAHVVVNGSLTWSAGAHTGARRGAVLCRASATVEGP